MLLVDSTGGRRGAKGASVPCESFVPWCPCVPCHHACSRCPPNEWSMHLPSRQPGGPLQIVGDMVVKSPSVEEGAVKPDSWMGLWMIGAAPC